jgi:hypothetical protein
VFEELEAPGEPPRTTRSEEKASTETALALSPLDAHAHREEAEAQGFRALTARTPSMMPESPPNSTARIKASLADAGLEVFRTRGEEIVLAERPRENLILDSGVRLRVTDAFEVRVVLRAQKGDFPNEDDSHLFERVRHLAARALAGGFAEVATTVTPIADPSDPERTLETFYEITYAKRVHTLIDAIAELRFALALEKRA